MSRSACQKKKKKILVEDWYEPLGSLFLSKEFIMLHPRAPRVCTGFIWMRARSIQETPWGVYSPKKGDSNQKPRLVYSYGTRVLEQEALICDTLVVRAQKWAKPETKPGLQSPIIRYSQEEGKFYERPQVEIGLGYGVKIWNKGRNLVVPNINGGRRKRVRRVVRPWQERRSQGPIWLLYPVLMASWTVLLIRLVVDLAEKPPNDVVKILFPSMHKYFFK